jgi:hypothetical protein
MMQHEGKPTGEQKPAAPAISAAAPQAGPPANIPGTLPEPAACDADEIAKQEEALLDEAIALTFPASDPISVPSYDEALEKSKWRKDRATRRPA